MVKYNKYSTKQGVKWHVRGYLGVDEATGKEEQFNKRGFKTKKEAQLSFSRAKLDYENGVAHITAKPNTYEEVYHEWLEIYKKDVKESTLNKTMTMFRLHILPEIGDYKIEKINHRKIQSLVNDWHGKYTKYKEMFNNLCRILDYAVKKEYIEHSPRNMVHIPKKKTVSKKEDINIDFYDRQDLKKFLEVLYQEKSYKWIAYFRLLAFTGLRKGEALALTWNDINFKDHLLTVDKTLTTGLNNRLYLSETPKTDAGNRTITLDDKTIEILKTWKSEQAELLLGFGFNAMKPKQLMFSKFKDNTYLNLSAPRNAMERIRKKGNLRSVRIHSFRHTHCSLLFEAGVQMKDVKERLGHSDIETTMNVYTHVTKESRDKSAELFANYVNF